MALYVYVVPVPEEVADAWQAYVDHCLPDPPSGVNIYGEGLCLGRPMLNSGALQAEGWYGKQWIGENEFTQWLGTMLCQYAGTTEGPDEEWRDWMVQNNRQCVIVCNDNEV